MRSFVVFCFLFALAFAQNQINPAVGRYAGACHQFGSSNLYGMTYLHMMNNGYFLRTNVFVGRQCTGGFDFAMQHGGILNVNFPPVAVAGFTGFDLGQEFRMAFATTQDGADTLNTACNTQVFGINRMHFMWNMTCPSLDIVPFHQCPMHYTIGQLNGNTLTLGGPPSCSADSRPTTMTTVFTNTAIHPYPWFSGLWQSNCFTPPQGQLSFSREMQIMDDFMVSTSDFVYNGPGCTASNLQAKFTHFGNLASYYPSPAIPSAVEVEVERMSAAVYPVSQDFANNLAQQCPELTFAANTLTDLSNATCGHFLGIHECPRIYDIMSIQNGQLFSGRPVNHEFADLCTPAGRPTTLFTHGSTNVSPYHFAVGNSNVGAVVVLVLLIIALTIAGVWICFKHRSNTLSALREFFCGGYSSSTYNTNV